MLDDAARVGLLTASVAGMYQIHPALPGYLAAAWHAQTRAGYGPEREKRAKTALGAATAAFSRWLTGQIDVRGRGPGLRDHRAAATEPRRDARPALDRQAWADADGIVGR